MDTGSRLPTVLVCVNARAGQASCGARGADELLALLRQRLREEAIQAVIEPAICLGRCAKGPNLRLLGGPFFHFADAEAIESIIAALKTQQRPAAPVVPPPPPRARKTAAARA